MIKHTFLALTVATFLFSCGGDKKTEEISTDLIDNSNTASGNTDEDKAPFFEFVEKVKDFVKSLKPKSKGKELEVRDYQIDAIRCALSNHRGMLVSPTASGKSLIIYALIRFYHYLLKDKKILILVPTTSLVEQMYSDFIDYGWNDKYLHRIYQGHGKETTKPVIISTWQSIYNLPKKWFKDVGMIIGDEAHLFKAVS